IWTTSRGHHLTTAEQRFTACDPTLTPILINTPGRRPGDSAAHTGDAGDSDSGPGADGSGRGEGGDGGNGNPGRSAGNGNPDVAHGGNGSPGRSGGNGNPDVAHGGNGSPGRSGGNGNPDVAHGGDGDRFGDDNGADWATTGQATNPTPATRIAALADLLLGGPRLPLAVGRSSRTATTAQRKALATRDHGCIIPGCHAPPETCQTHHLHDWATGGAPDLDNLALLCWTHHRQVDLHMWTIEPRHPGQPPPPDPHPGAPPGTPWPANNGAPFTITRQPRTRWRQ
ncbi:MAG: HNH endonuclease signature motif containing protein, partial [Candidatus Nanopelagicales bacterium]